MAPGARVNCGWIALPLELGAVLGQGSGHKAVGDQQPVTLSRRPRLMGSEPPQRACSPHGAGKAAGGQRKSRWSRLLGSFVAGPRGPLGPGGPPAAPGEQPAHGAHLRLCFLGAQRRPWAPLSPGLCPGQEPWRCRHRKNRREHSCASCGPGCLQALPCPCRIWLLVIRSFTRQPASQGGPAPRWE